MSAVLGVSFNTSMHGPLADRSARGHRSPDTTEALKRLQRRFKLGVLSNVDHGSFAVTEKNLGVMFDLVVTAADVGTYKPNP